MTVDERLDRLTEHHEALTQSLELLTPDVRDLTADVREQTKNMDNLMIGFGAIAELVRRQETRLDGLEGR